METLQDLLLEHQRKTGDSARDFERKAAALGHPVDRTTIAQIAAGTYRRKTQERTFDAIAAVTGVPVETVRALAGRPPRPKPFAEELPPDTDHLSPASRRAVVGVIRALLNAESGAVTPGDEASPDNVRELPKRGTHGGERAAARRRPKGEPRGEDPSS
jgi:hypothetical protein